MSLLKTIPFRIPVKTLIQEIQKYVPRYSVEEIEQALFDAYLWPEGYPILITSNINVGSNDWVTAAVLDIMSDLDTETMRII